MRLYELDEVDETLELLPMAARRALDRAGKKVSLAEWKKQPLAVRRQLTALGSEAHVDVPLVQRVLAGCGAVTTGVEAPAEPTALAVPDEVRQAYGSARPIPVATWSALSALDRYVLSKVAAKGRAERLEQAYREIVGQSALSNHLEPQGGLRMVNVEDKPVTRRTAVAEAWVTLSEDALTRLVQRDGPKGDVLAVARIAAIQAAKKTPDLIPLCHAIALTKVSVQFEVDAPARTLRIEVTTHANDRTGVEMEAMTAASVAGLTVYDMLKGVDRGISLGPIRLAHKSGGRTGDYDRRANDGEGSDEHSGVRA